MPLDTKSESSEVQPSDGTTHADFPMDAGTYLSRMSSAEMFRRDLSFRNQAEQMRIREV